MTPLQEQRITELRQQNFSYRYIGEQVDMPLNTVKSICRRRGIESFGPRKRKVEKKRSALCHNCLCYLDHKGDARDRRFCSDACRMEWWKKKRRVRPVGKNQ